MDPFSQNVDEHSQLQQYFTQHQAVDTLAQDFDSFENMFLDPSSIDPLNYNQFFDWNYLQRFLNDDMTDEDAQYVGGDEGGAIQIVTVTNYGGGSGSGNGGLVASQMSDGISVGGNNMMNAQPQAGENVKKWGLRKKYKKGSEEVARRLEKNKIRNRESAAKSLEKKKAYNRDMQLQIQKLRKENAYLRNFLKFQEANSKIDTTGKQLQRTASGQDLYTRS